MFSSVFNEICECFHRCSMTDYWHFINYFSDALEFHGLYCSANAYSLHIV